MRHYKKGRKLGTDASHTKAMKKSLCVALFENDRIKTTEARAKEIRGDVDKVITWAKKGDLHSRRLAIAALGDKELVREIFEKVEQGMFEGRNGGYTRIMKLGNRKGDSAPMVIIELVDEMVLRSDEPEVEPLQVETKPVEADDEADEVEDVVEDIEDVEDLAEDIEEAVDEVAEDVADAAEEVADAAEEVAEDVAEAAEEAAEAVEEAVEEAAE